MRDAIRHRSHPHPGGHPHGRRSQLRLVDGIGEAVKPAGFPTIEELLGFMRENNNPVYGWGIRCRARRVAEEVVREGSGSGYKTPKELAEWVGNADRVITT